ncbi:hypothetical protein [Rhizobium binxianense]|uniref:hypothetical protein n=2 Tax=Rhizobium TaxID=379 RepID=UPI00234F7A21|nr:MULTISPECIES: hypothetical protein [unclassified Rhizobium]MDC7742596.1 hypothetical protein [Rhizobium sp. BC56]MDC9812025.1 hypothetical protein [Rhizobium sp. MC62]WEA27302.1 hypothetical protein PO862_08290 [Rhizobium sp. MJ22]WEA61776.1 hypothetical protein PO860_07965 [Rhizobium sp. BJ04]
MQVYDTRHEALMVWRNLQLITCVDDDRLEEFDIVTVDREIREQAQFTHPQTKAESVNISQAGPKTNRVIIARTRPQSTEIQIVSNDAKW